MYLLVWTTVRKDPVGRDMPVYTEHCDASETMGDARIEYERIRMEPDTYTASICAVVDSTDYDIHPRLRGVTL